MKFLYVILMVFLFTTYVSNCQSLPLGLELKRNESIQVWNGYPVKLVLGKEVSLQSIETGKEALGTNFLHMLGIKMAGYLYSPFNTIGPLNRDHSKLFLMVSLYSGCQIKEFKGGYYDSCNGDVYDKQGIGKDNDIFLARVNFSDFGDHIEVVKIEGFEQLDNEVSPNCRYDYGCIKNLVYLRDKRQLKQIISEIPEVVFLTNVNNFSVTHLLCGINMADLLEGTSADLNVMSDFGDTPLSVAVRTGSKDSVTYLLDHGVAREAICVNEICSLSYETLLERFWGK